jgi:branched-chain amino acid transport system substrate-binding protein
MTTAGADVEGGGAKVCTPHTFRSASLLQRAVHLNPFGLPGKIRPVPSSEESSAVITSARRPFRVACALVLTLLGAACTSSSTTQAATLPSTVTIGLLTAKTGNTASSGADAIRGAQLAVDVVNTPYPVLPLPLGPSPGLHNGVKLALAVGDTQGAPERVEDQASQLVKNGAVGLVLADDIEVARSAGHEVDIIGVALVDASSTADLFADLNQSGHFRIQPTDRSAVETTMALLFRQHAVGKGVGRLAVVGPPGAPGANEEADSIRTAISDIGQSEGYLPVTSQALGPGGASPGDLVKAIGENNADVTVAIVTTAAEASAAVDLAARLKGETPVIAVGPAAALIDPGKAAGSSILRVVGWSGEFTQRNPVALAIAQMYQRAYNAPMSQTAASAFTATLALASAIDSAKSLGAVDVRSATQQLSVPATQTIMPWDGIQFDSDGDNQLGTPVVEQRTGSGFQIVYPNELASAPIAWP